MNIELCPICGKLPRLCPVNGCWFCLGEDGEKHQLHGPHFDPDALGWNKMAIRIKEPLSAARGAVVENGQLKAELETLKKDQAYFVGAIRLCRENDELRRAGISDQITAITGAYYEILGERNKSNADLAAACGCRTFDQNLIECEYHAAQSDELRAARAKIRELETANLPLYSDRVKDLENEIERLRALVELSYQEGREDQLLYELTSTTDRWAKSKSKAALNGGKEE